MGKGKLKHEKINDGQEDEMTITGFRCSIIKTLMMWILVLLSAGTLLILIALKPRIRLLLSHSRCSLDEAHKVLLMNNYEEEFVEVVVKPKVTASSPNEYTYFFNKKLKYIWQRDFGHFQKVGGLEIEHCGNFYSMRNGLTQDEVTTRLKLYDPNSIFIDVKPVHKLVLREITSPFYMYQMFIVVVWLIQLYYQFCLCIVVMSFISITATVWQTRKQSVALRDQVESHSFVTVVRDGLEVSKSSHDLVPGDVLVMGINTQNFQMECDAVIISGSCVVNESMLTGESNPISKVAIPNDDALSYSPASHKKNTLFCGTEILQTKPMEERSVKAIVYRTGFNTVKGDLVRSILFPKPVSFRLYRELFCSMIIFLFLGVPAMVYTAVIWYNLGAFTWDIVIIVIDVATFVVPPLLPAVMTSVNAHAQRRLRKNNVYCLNPSYINFCGGLDVVCFDKTGTLTEDSLDLSGVVPAIEASFQPAVKDLSSIPNSPLLLAMTTCHSLSKVDNKLMGYTLDKKMFEAVGWDLEEPKHDQDTNFEKLPARIVRPRESEDDPYQLEVAILRQFPFESTLQRMTVVTAKTNTDHFDVYMKGAPEMISSFSTLETIPENFQAVLEMYTRQGFRVLAVAKKSLPPGISWDNIQKLDRNTIEDSLEFCGFIVLKNKLKLETKPVLNVLKNANIRSIMVTGDNLLTAISVARDCNMVAENDSVIAAEAEHGGIDGNVISRTLHVNYTYAKMPGYSEKINVGRNGLIDDVHIPLLNEGKYHIAMDGKTFNLIKKYDPVLLDKVVQKGTIFARMSPEQKLNLIETLQQLGYQVGMCGDGANDCGALKMAHAGISLSMAEASVASPFTSNVQNIGCIPTVIREGRATLVATFGVFRFMVTYCFVLLSSVLFMFWDGQKPSDGAYVIIDIVLGLIPPIIFGSTEAFEGLAKRPPIRSILSFIPQFSIISFILIQIGANITAWRYCISQPWYEPFVYSNSTTHTSEPSHLGTTILSINMMSYVIAAVIFAPGPPYRKKLFSNKLYFGIVLLEFIFVAILTLYPPAFVRYYLNFKMAPFFEYHMILFGISIGNFLVSYLWETCFIQYFLFEVIQPRIRKLRGPIYKFEKLEEELKRNTNWPPLGKAPPDWIPDLKRVSSINSPNDVPGDVGRRTSNRLMRQHSGDSYLRWNSSLPVTECIPMESSRQPLSTFVTAHEGSHYRVSAQNPRMSTDSYV